MPDVSNTLAANFGAFDGLTYAMMAIIVVGAAYMMPGIAAIVTATTGALFVFAFSIFLRSVLAGGDTASVVRGEWTYVLALPLGMLLVYAAVFGFGIATVHLLRMAAKQ